MPWAVWVMRSSTGKVMVLLEPLVLMTQLNEYQGLVAVNPLSRRSGHSTHTVSW
jgi:hypothetical protein